VCRTNAELELTFRLDGNISRICLSAPVGRSDQAELWRHTCFEVFVAIEGQAAYHEFNFAPSSEWRIYAFSAYRDPDPALLCDQLRSPIVDVRSTGERLELDIRIGLSRLSELHPHSALRLGLSAIIESCNGTLSYWALHHPPGAADFHHSEAFALRLEAP
jgi:hypothetical protein